MKFSIKNAVHAPIKMIMSAIPARVLAFTYTVILKAKPLKALANFCISFLIEEKTEIPEGFIALNKKDPVVSGSVALGVYEKSESALFRKKVKNGMVVIDVGANIGYFTVISAQLVGPFGRVISFEPEPENFSFLKETVALNKFSNIEIYDLALSDKVGKGTLFLSKTNKGDHRMFDPGNASESIDISMTTLDDFLMQKGIQKVDFIKMDIQGAEALALDGMKNTMAHNKRISLIIEFCPHDLLMSKTEPLSLLNKLKGLGFKIFEIKEGLRLNLVSDFNSLIKRHSGTKYTNLYCKR